MKWGPDKMSVKWLFTLSVWYADINSWCHNQTWNLHIYIATKHLGTLHFTGRIPNYILYHKCLLFINWIKHFFFSHRVIWEVHICCGIPQSHLRLILSTQFFKQLCKEAMKVGKPYSTSKGYKKNLN